MRSRFDYCLIDSGAGLGDAFRLATCAADRAVVVATTDPTSLRDAQRTVMELRDYPSGRLHLVVNRVRRKLLKALSSNIDAAIELKRNAALLAMDVQLKNAQLLLKLVKSSAILRLIQYFLASVRDKLSLLLWNGRVA